MSASQERRHASYVDRTAGLLRNYFGAEVDDALETLREVPCQSGARRPFGVMDLLIIYKWADAFAPLNVEAPVAPIDHDAQAAKGR